MAKKSLKIAVIPGDGIGVEVMPYGVRALEAAAKVFDLSLEFEWFDFASCAYYRKHGDMLPADWKETLLRFDAIYFGAVGLPDAVPRPSTFLTMSKPSTTSPIDKRSMIRCDRGRDSSKKNIPKTT